MLILFILVEVLFNVPRRISVLQRRSIYRIWLLDIYGATSKPT